MDLSALNPEKKHAVWLEEEETPNPGIMHASPLHPVTAPPPPQAGRLNLFTFASFLPKSGHFKFTLKRLYLTGLC